MGNLQIFSQSTYVFITLFSLGLLFFSCFYATGSNRLTVPVWLIFIAFVMEFCANGVAAQAGHAYSLGASVTLYSFIELTLLLLAMVLMGIAASQLLTRSLPSSPMIILVCILGFVAIIFFLFVSPDDNMVNKMRQIFPLAGIAYLAVSFWSQTINKNSNGFFLAALITTGITAYLGLRMAGIAFAGSGFWFVSAASYTLLAFAFILINEDLTTRKLIKTELEIEKYNKRIEEIIKSSPFPIIISRLSDDRLVLVNNNAVKLFGINPYELDRYRLRDFFADADNRQLLSEHLEQEKEVQDFEVLVKTPISETPFWLLASANIIDYNYDVALYSAYQDITSRKNREALLKNQATRDPLTSLYNRRYFEDEVTKQILKAKAAQSPYSVLMLDADFFKRVNDTYGHKVGDKVLIELASTTERALRDNDIVARYGGEEFVVFLPGINADQARAVADRLRSSIASVVVYSDENQPVTFTVSIGVSSSEISDNIDTLIKTADEALYRAKQNGRNRVEVFSSDDLQEYDLQGQVERKDESQNHHPVFDKDNNMEISLLDGIETSKIDSERTFVEEPETAGDIRPENPDKSSRQ